MTSLPTFANDIKTPTMDNEKDGEMLIRSPPRRSRPLAIGFAAIALCYFLWTMFTPHFARLNCWVTAPGSPEHPIISTKNVVPFEAHIMSKCPDARDCLREMVLPTMQRVYDKVNFTLSYIGT
jgi:hypothetical protein